MVEQTHTAGWWPNLSQPLRNIGQKVADWVAPRSDASAMEDCYEINMELPGVKAEDIDVSIHDHSLVVRGEKRSEHQETGRSYFFSEREFGSFQRSFRLPPDANGETVDAEFRNGVLRLRIAKHAASEAAARKIAVRKV